MKRFFPGATWRGVLVGGLALGVAITAAQALSQTASHERVVTMANMSYGQIPTDLKVGDTIVWVNHDTVPHTVTARDKSFDVRVNVGQTVRQPLTRAGVFPFICIYHAAMRGTLTVAAK